MQKNKKGIADEADKNCERVMLDETKPKRKSKAKQKPKQKTKVKRTYKDSLFRMIFANKENLLSLYNAVNDTNYTNPDELTVMTLKNAIYMTMKNDISCMIDTRLQLFEHQSTVNLNMPLRDLFYVAKQYSKLVDDEDIYAKKRVMLPTPRFIVFYNGTEYQPDKVVMRLSDSFEKKCASDEINLELVVEQYNINAGHNEKLLESCQTLHEYACFVDKCRENIKKYPLDEAMERTVDECIKEGILADILRANRAEVIEMNIFEFDQEAYEDRLKKEGELIGRSEGVITGRNEGIIIGRKEGIITGRKEGKIDDIFELLSELGEIPESLKAKISVEENIDTLSKWIKLAARVESIAEFEERYLN